MRGYFFDKKFNNILNLKFKSCLSKYDSFVKFKSNNVYIENIIYTLTILFVFFVIFLLNAKTAMTGDDYVYSFIHNTQIRINSLNDIFASQYSHYFTWGGRSVVHTIAQLLILIDDKIIIRLINTIAFVCFIICIQYHVKGRVKNDSSLFFLIFTLIWILQPAFGETIFWITGSVNYLWGTLIILTFLLPYRLYNNSKDQGKICSLISFFLMFFLGVIAGWTNENTAAAMILIIILFIIYYRKSLCNIPLWMYTGLVGSIVGYILMILAPGNFIRAEGTCFSLFLVVYRTLTYTQTFVNYLGVLNLGFLVCLILFMKFSDGKKEQILLFSSFFLLASLASIYIMIFSPGFPARAWFGSITLNIIAFSIIFNNLNVNLRFVRGIKAAILFFCFITFIFSFYDAYKDVNEIDLIWKGRLSKIKEKKEIGDSSITFKEYQAKTKFGLGDARYAQKYMSQYYGIEFLLD